MKETIILNFEFRFLEQISGKKIYGCIMHHPLREALFTPTSYPVDEIHMIYNAIIEEPLLYECKEIMNEEHVIVTISFTDQKDIAEKNETNIILFDVEWNSKITYHLPIYDCTESWEFVFSKEPIDKELYLEGYVQTRENVFVCKKDLEENLRRKRLMF